MTVSVAILGATGVVAQKAIALLANREEFQIIELVASEARIGKKFHTVCDWRELLVPMPEKIAQIELSSAEALKADFILSCLPSEVALELEPMLANQGKFVFSNASAFRMARDVPLLVPEINLDHLSLLKEQPYKGKIVTNPNCSAVGVTLALAPLRELDLIEHVSVVTLQSVSGAGYPGVASLDIMGNTVPHIEDEAEKITEESKKILGSSSQQASFAMTTSVNRVAVVYGHVAVLHIQFQSAVLISDVIELYHERNKRYKDLYVLHSQKGRPQSLRDLNHHDMRIHIGHIKQGDRPNIVSMTVLSHNLVRGAAGAVIANMESFLNFSMGVR